MILEEKTTKNRWKYKVYTNKRSQVYMPKTKKREKENNKK